MSTAKQEDLRKHLHLKNTIHGNKIVNTILRDGDNNLARSKLLIARYIKYIREADPSSPKERIIISYCTQKNRRRSKQHKSSTAIPTSIIFLDHDYSQPELK